MRPDHGALDWGVVAIFVTVYLGMILGGLPRLKLDRAGVALLGAIGVIGLGDMSSAQAADAVDLPTILLLFSFMVLSAQMGMSGFYIAVTRWLVALPLSRPGLLAALIAVAAAPPGPGALSGRLGLRRQYRLGGDPDRQPAKHADWLGAALAVRPLCASGLAPGLP